MLLFPTFSPSALSSPLQPTLLPCRGREPSLPVFISLRLQPRPVSPQPLRSPCLELLWAGFSTAPASQEHICNEDGVSSFWKPPLGPAWSLCAPQHPPFTVPHSKYRGDGGPRPRCPQQVTTVQDQVVSQAALLGGSRRGLTCPL